MSNTGQISPARVDDHSLFSSVKVISGPTLTWSDVNFSVGDKKILRDVSGEVSSEEVCAILGPSGAGKSSLLNVLAGRSTTRSNIVVTSDQVRVDGTKIDPVAYRRNVAYVMQDDALIATSTPREALHFSAALRLPSVQPDRRKLLVERMLKELRLEDCADVIVGDELLKGLSGGQRKRTSVGVELVTNPRLVFLDEPTSGLDSVSAMTMVQLLKKVASRGTTMLCTIHQPSSEVFELFDKVMLMKDGRVLHVGPTAEIPSFWESRGHPIKAHYNPADAIMSTTVNHSETDLEAAGFYIDKKIGGSEGTSAAAENHSIQATSSSNTQSGLLKQIGWLVKREMRGLRRDPRMLGGRFGVTIFLSILFGIIFSDAGKRDNAVYENLSAHFGALTMVTISSMFGTAQPVMLSFPFERPVFLREYTTGTYSTFAYFVSKGAVELPLALLQSLVQFTIIYPLLGLRGNFVLMVLASWALGIASSSVAVVLGCSVADVKTVAELAPAVFVPQLLFAGFFVSVDFIPSYLRWAQYLCALKYGLNLQVLNEFSDCGDGSDNPSLAIENCDSLKERNDVYGSQAGLYIGILLALFCIFRLLGASILLQKAKTFY